MQNAEESKLKEGAPAANPDGRPDLSVSAPAPDAGQQPGFKVVEETPRAGSSNKIVWTALFVAIAILAAYALGFFR